MPSIVAFSTASFGAAAPVVTSASLLCRMPADWAALPFFSASLITAMPLPVMCLSSACDT